MVAIMSMLISMIVGDGQESGRLPETWSTALETLTMAESILVPSVNSSCTMEKFSLLTELTFSTLEMVPRAFSMGLLTSVSTFSGLAPG